MALGEQLQILPRLRGDAAVADLTACADVLKRSRSGDLLARRLSFELEIQGRHA